MFSTRRLNGNTKVDPRQIPQLLARAARNPALNRKKRQNPREERRRIRLSGRGREKPPPKGGTTRGETARNAPVLWPELESKALERDVVLFVRGLGEFVVDGVDRGRAAARIAGNDFEV